jgi:hypothetical protein
MVNFWLIDRKSRMEQIYWKIRRPVAGADGCFIFTQPQTLLRDARWQATRNATPPSIKP